GDRVEQAHQCEHDAAREPETVGEPTERDGDHEAEQERRQALAQMLEGERPDEVGVADHPVHVSSSTSTPWVRPAVSTSTVPRAVCLRRSARDPRSTPMKEATKSLAGASMISEGDPSCAIRAPSSRITT